MLRAVNSCRAALFKRWKWKQTEVCFSSAVFIFALSLKEKKKQKNMVNLYSPETLPPGAALINNLKMG